jgi:uncharacterized protein (DUF302 family)
MYSYKTEVEGSFTEALEQVKAALQTAGFSILTELNIKEKMKQTLGADYDEYRVLGACNPPFAHQALQAEQEVGLLLPCNVIVYQAEEKTWASTVLPTTIMGVIENDQLHDIAVKIEVKLCEAIDSL